MPSGENGETPENPADDPLPMAVIDDPGEDFAAEEPRGPATDGDGGGNGSGFVPRAPRMTAATPSSEPV